jgi:DNA-binding SARP family transcriptional activator
MKATLFGDFRIETPSGELVVLSNRRAALLLAVLCLAPGHAIDREALARLLWPDRFLAQAKASLRQCLLDLRRKLEDHGIDCLVVSRGEVALAPGSLACDLFELEAGLSADDPEAAIAGLLAIGNRPLIQGPPFNPEFDEWIATRRDHIDAQLRAAISAAIRNAPKATSERLLEAARARFSSYRTFNPSAHQARIALLPFSQIDSVGGNFFLADGIVDELGTRLTGINGIALAGRTSIAAVIDKGLTLTEIASDLGVTYLIEGEVRRDAQGISVRMALISGQSGTEVWSDRLGGSIEDFFDGRRVIGANVIAAICRALGLTASPAPLRKMTHDREAYALYLQARAMIQKIGVEGAFAKGIAFLEQALAIDPDFAECWTALANAHIMTAALTPSLERVAQSAEAARCAERAIALDPGQGHAFSILGIHEWTRFNPARALEMAFEAYARDPNDADVCSRLGSCLLYLGKAREALPYVEEAVDRDPVYGRNYAMLTSAYLSLGEIDKALVTGQRLADLGNPSMWLALAQMAAGDHVTAVQTHFDTRLYLGTIIMRPPGMPPMDDAARDAYFAFAARGIFSGEEADRAAYCQMLGGLHATMSDPYDSSIAFPAIWMGHSELVMKIYAECIHPANMFGLMNLWIDIDPVNRTIRDPRFMEFAERIGMVEAWERFGWPDLIPVDPRTP